MSIPSDSKLSSDFSVLKIRNTIRILESEIQTSLRQNSILICKQETSNLIEISNAGTTDGIYSIVCYFFVHM